MLDIGKFSILKNFSSFFFHQDFYLIRHLSIMQRFEKKIFKNLWTNENDDDDDEDGEICAKIKSNSSKNECSKHILNPVFFSFADLKLKYTTTYLYYYGK